jgi:hypothetical protein
MTYSCAACGEPLGTDEPVTHARRSGKMAGEPAGASRDVLFHPRHFPTGSTFYQIQGRITTLGTVMGRLGDTLDATGGGPGEAGRHASRSRR